MFKPKVFVLLVVVLEPLFSAGAYAQPAPDSSRAAHPKTFQIQSPLQAWADKQRLLVLDRRHNRGDRPYDRGIFRHVTPKTGREYALDILVQDFLPDAFTYGRQAQNRLLLRAGSVRRDLLAVVSRFQSRIPLDTTQALTFDVVLQEDGRATRSFLEIGYTWQLTPHHSIGLRHTFSEYKPDLDVTGQYRYSNRTLGRAEVAVTVQNLYSDFIDQQLGIVPGDRDIVRDYGRPPFLLSVSYASPDRYALRGELVGAVQPMSDVTVESQTTPAYQYRDDRRVHFFGALLEYRFSSVATGLFYKRDVSWLRRVGTGADVSSDYTARQHFHRFGMFARGAWDPLRASVRGFVGSYRDRQTGTDFSQSLLPQEIDYDERQQGLQARLLYESDSGPMAGMEYAGLRRMYPPGESPHRVGRSFVFAPWTRQWWGFGPSNHRLVGLVGYEFGRGRIIAGVGYDLDGDDAHPADHAEKAETSRFDGGFGRLVLTW